jgi:putative ABC transport system permease protein
MAGLLLGAALALPVVLSAVLNQLLGRSRSVLGQWFLADCRQQLPALSLALMALLLALAANIGAGSMTAGFRQTFNDWLEQRLTAELYLNPQNPAQSRETAHLAQTTAERQAVLPNWQVATVARLAGGCLRRDRSSDYRQHWPLLEALPVIRGRTWRRTTRDAQRATGAAAEGARGDHLSVPTPGGPWSPRIVGIYADYGNPKGHCWSTATTCCAVADADAEPFQPAHRAARHPVVFDGAANALSAR